MKKLRNTIDLSNHQNFYLFFFTLKITEDYICLSKLFIGLRLRLLVEHSKVSNPTLRAELTTQFNNIQFTFGGGSRRRERASGGLYTPPHPPSSMYLSCITCICACIATCLQACVRVCLPVQACVCVRACALFFSVLYDDVSSTCPKTSAHLASYF